MEGWDWYSVHLEARAPGNTPEAGPSESVTDAFMDLLEKHDGIVSADAQSWAATVSVEAATALEAAFLGYRRVMEMAEKADMPGWPIVRTEVTRHDVLDAESERPGLPEVVSVPEVAEILGVSPQRVHELAAGHAGFPEPVYELRTGRLWLRDAIEAFAQRWERKPGRPRAAAFHIRPGEEAAQ
jgi:hypothetical protein